MLDLVGFVPQPKHHYTFAATGMKVKNKTFASRHLANEYMYNIMSKHNLNLVKIYDDKHFKTYICDNDVRFYIHRA